MNIANITALTRQLESLDFKSISHLLLKKMSFKPNSFSILQIVEKGMDQVHFSLFFEKENKENVYALRYYDAVIQKATIPFDLIINSIQLADLETSMKEVDWKAAFNFNTDKEIVLEDKTTWEEELKVESIIESLFELEKSDDGKTVAMEFKLKYWTGIPFQEIFGNITPLKNKAEVSQRFYFSEGQTGISVDEAYRFLQNRWLEKQIQIKRKQGQGLEPIESESGTQDTSANSQRKHKRFSKTKKSKV